MVFSWKTRSTVVSEVKAKKARAKMRPPALFCAPDVSRLTWKKTHPAKMPMPRARSQ